MSFSDSEALNLRATLKRRINLTGGKNEQGVCIYRPNVGSFAVRAGREIVIDPLPCVDERALRLTLLGPALALLLHQRDLFVLASSAVRVQAEDGGDGDFYGVAFLGYSGAGKSTTARRPSQARLHVRRRRSHRG